MSFSDFDAVNPQQGASGRAGGPGSGTPGFGIEHVVQPATFNPLPTTSPIIGGQSIDFLYDVVLQISVELGRTEMSIRDILNMGQGTVIELNRLAGEPVDILVNGKAIARGEVVVIDDKFGVRVLDVVSPRDRLNTLR